MRHLLHKARELDTISRVAIIILLVLFSYILLICILFPLLAGERTLFSDTLLDFSEPEHVHLNLIAALLSIGLGVAAAIVTGQHHPAECPEQKRILTDVLSKDEQQVLAVVKETGEITQDSLTFRLGWSRPKVSTIITNLERMNVVQRRREGKTYVIFVAPKRH
jgi:uncharacterized membrane protein